MSEREGRAVRVTVCAEGPLIVRGAREIIGDDGEVFATHRRTVAVCRCGASAIKPWCDGTHKMTLAHGRVT